MKPFYVLSTALALTMLLMAACGPAAAPAQEVVQQPVVEQPTLAPTVEVAPPPPEPTQPQYAPFCQAAPAACEPPVVELRDNAYCDKGHIYAILVAPPETTYEPLDSGLTCSDQMRGDGMMNITCKAKEELYSYELKVCNSACAAPSLAMDTGQCPAGYGFDTTNQCCAEAAPSTEGGCTNFKVDIGSCLSVD